MEIKQLLQLAVDREASDLHIITGIPAFLRIEGRLNPIPGEAAITPEVVNKFVKEILSSEQLERLSVNKEIDFSLPYNDKARFRVNAYTQKGNFAIAFRRIPLSIPKIDELNLPQILHTFTGLRQGFILVTGPTGHGKSTTLASMINEINFNRSEHIVTIEDPIEFI